MFFQSLLETIEKPRSESVSLENQSLSVPSQSPLLLDIYNGICPGLLRQTPLGMCSGSSHRTSPHKHPGSNNQQTNICYRCIIGPILK